LAPALALAVLDAFLVAAFEGGRHAARLAEIAAIEREECDGRAG
jgi:ribose 5-phosphate isomerase RpiB